jgi:hypothetical protein
LRHNAETLVARLFDGFQKSPWLPLHFLNFIPDPSGPVEVNEERDFFILRSLALTKNQKLWIKRGGLLGKVFGEFGHLNLAPERRYEKCNDNKKELHGYKRAVNI